MSYILVRSSLLLTALLSSPVVLPCFGCQCLPMDNPSEAKEKARAVVVGMVAELIEKGNFVKVRIHVAVAFKGVLMNSLDIEIQTPSGGPAVPLVAPHFLKGQSYLIDTGPGLGVNHCSRTRTLDEASEDLRFLHSPVTLF